MNVFIEKRPCFNFATTARNWTSSSYVTRGSAPRIVKCFERLWVVICFTALDGTFGTCRLNSIHATVMRPPQRYITVRIRSKWCILDWKQSDKFPKNKRRCFCFLILAVYCSLPEQSCAIFEITTGLYWARLECISGSVWSGCFYQAEETECFAETASYTGNLFQPDPLELA